MSGLGTLTFPQMGAQYRLQYNILLKARTRKRIPMSGNPHRMDSCSSINRHACHVTISSYIDMRGAGPEILKEFLKEVHMK